MRHMTENELKHQLKYKPDTTIKEYLQECREMWEEEQAVANSQGIPEHVERRVAHGQMMFNERPRKTIWKSIV